MSLLLPLVPLSPCLLSPFPRSPCSSRAASPVPGVPCPVVPLSPLPLSPVPLFFLCPRPPSLVSLIFPSPLCHCVPIYLSSRVPPFAPCPAVPLSPVPLSPVPLFSSCPHPPSLVSLVPLSPCLLSPFSSCARVPHPLCPLFFRLSPALVRAPCSLLFRPRLVPRPSCPLFFSCPSPLSPVLPHPLAPCILLSSVSCVTCSSRSALVMVVAELWSSLCLSCVFIIFSSFLVCLSPVPAVLHMVCPPCCRPSLFCSCPALLVRCCPLSLVPVVVSSPLSPVPRCSARPSGFLSFLCPLVSCPPVSVLRYLVFCAPLSSVPCVPCFSRSALVVVVAECSKSLSSVPLVRVCHFLILPCARLCLWLWLSLCFWLSLSVLWSPACPPSVAHPLCPLFLPSPLCHCLPLYLSSRVPPSAPCPVVKHNARVRSLCLSLFLFMFSVFLSFFLFFLSLFLALLLSTLSIGLE